MEEETDFYQICFTKMNNLKDNTYKISYILNDIPSIKDIDLMVNLLNDLKLKENRSWWIDYFKEEKRINEEEDNRWKNEQKIRKSLKLPPKQKGYIYIIKSQNLYKIGRAKNINNRTKKYITENPFEIEVVFKLFVDDCVKEEDFLLKTFEKFWIRGEWFNLKEEDIIKIKQHYGEKV